MMVPMRSLATLVALTLALPVGPARAEEPLVLPSGTLTVEPDFWGVYGLRLLRDGEEVGPGFLALGVEAAVAGSPRAEAHAAAARNWAIANLVLAVIGSGLLAGSMATHADERGTLGGWPDLVPSGGVSASSVLGLGMLLSLTGSVICRYGTYEEIVLAVSAYHEDR